MYSVVESSGLGKEWQRVDETRRNIDTRKKDKRTSNFPREDGLEET